MRNPKVGQRVSVKRLHPIDEHNNQMTPYIGQTGLIVLELPAEWDYPKMYRVEFDNKDTEPLAFQAYELDPA